MFQRMTIDQIIIAIVFVCILGCGLQFSLTRGKLSTEELSNIGGIVFGKFDRFRFGWPNITAYTLGFFFGAIFLVILFLPISGLILKTIPDTRIARFACIFLGFLFCEICGFCCQLSKIRESNIPQHLKKILNKEEIIKSTATVLLFPFVVFYLYG